MAQQVTAKELRKAIFESEDIPEKIVPVPEWGDVEILVRGMNGKQRAKFLRRATDPVTGQVSWENFYPDLVIATAHQVDTKELIFEDADRDTLNQKSGMALSRVAEAAQKLSGLGGDDVEEAKKD
jgi:hypothetical protein